MKLHTKYISTRQLRHLPILLILVTLWVTSSAYTPTPLLAQDIPITYEHFDTEMTLNEDGMLHVRIVQQIRFDDEFQGAFYAIPLHNVTSINNVQLYGVGTESANYELNTPDLVPITPNEVTNTGDEIYIDWSFPRTQPGDVRLFVIEYDAFGVVWVYPEQDFVSWKGVNEDRSGIVVNESEIQFTLPDIIPMDQVSGTSNLDLDGAEITGNTLTFYTDQPIADGIPFEVTVSFPDGILDVGVRQWQRDYDNEFLDIAINTFHADLTINQDGTLNLAEVTTATILDGALHQGSRAIKMLYLDQITEPTIAINEQSITEDNGNCTGCFTLNPIPSSSNWVYVDPDTDQVMVNEDNAGSYNIDWYTALPIQSGENVTTTITYQAAGAIRVGETDQLLTWQVVPNFGQPVQQASFQIHLPPRVTADQVTIEGPTEQGTPQVQPDGSLLFRFDGPVVPDAWQVAITLPANATRGQKPLWQSQFESAAAQADAAAVARARSVLTTRIIGILAIVGVILGIIMAWFRWGRRKVKETLGGYISEPPSQQSPAMVAYLVDRDTSEQGVLGSIFYLASFKLIEIDLEGGIKLRRIHNQPIANEARLTDVYGNAVIVPRHVRLLFDQVLLRALPDNEWATLESIAPTLRAALPEIYASLGADLQRYFVKIPGSGNDTIPASLWFFTYAILIGLMFFEIIPWMLGFFLGFLAIFAYVIWSAISNNSGYSDEGAVEAQKWRRFRTYLQEIKKFGDLAAAQEIIDRYFGYAVALGVEKVLLAQTAEMGGLRPIWMPSTTPGQPTTQTDPRPHLPRNTANTSWFPRPRPGTTTTPGIEPQRPTLAGMSEQLGNGLSQASRNIASILSVAAGDASNTSRSVTFNSQLQRRDIQWQPNTPVTKVLDEIMRQSVADARAIQAREIARREASRNTSNSWDWGDGSNSGSSSGSSSSSSSSSSWSSGSSSRSSSSFGSSSRSSSSSSSRSSSSSSSRSGGGGRSGFR